MATRQGNRIRRVYIEMVVKLACLSVIVSLPLLLGGLIARLSTSPSVWDVLLTSILLGMFGGLVYNEVSSAKGRLPGISTLGRVLIAYGEEVPLLKVRTAFVGQRVVWLDLADGVRMILNKSDFDDIGESLAVLASEGIEVREHTSHVPPPESTGRGTKR